MAVKKYKVKPNFYFHGGKGVVHKPGDVFEADEEAVADQAWKVVEVTGKEPAPKKPTEKNSEAKKLNASVKGAPKDRAM